MCAIHTSIGYDENRDIKPDNNDGYLQFLCNHNNGFILQIDIIDLGL